MAGTQQALNTSMGFRKGKKDKEGRSSASVSTHPPEACQGLLLWVGWGA